MKKILLVANWKMNPRDEKEAVMLAESVERGIKGIEDVEVVLCPPFIYLLSVQKKLLHASIGAQDCFWEQAGAFTGEISPSMLAAMGCSYVILGHSERKNHLQESTAAINKKIHAVMAADLTPVVCIGEQDKDRVDSHKAVERQMQDILKDIDREHVPQLVLTYEPEWAISTNKNTRVATPQDSKTVIRFMRTVLAEMFGEFDAEQVQILYGGSVDSRNIKAFITDGEAQGALVGGASLQANEFASLVKNATA